MQRLPATGRPTGRVSTQESPGLPQGPGILRSGASLASVRGKDIRSPTDWHRGREWKTTDRERRRKEARNAVEDKHPYPIDPRCEARGSHDGQRHLSSGPGLSTRERKTTGRRRGRLKKPTSRGKEK